MNLHISSSFFLIAGADFLSLSLNGVFADSLQATKTKKTDTKYYIKGRFALPSILAGSYFVLSLSPRGGNTQLCYTESINAKYYIKGGFGLPSILPGSYFVLSLFPRGCNSQFSYFLACNKWAIIHRLLSLTSKRNC